VSKLRRKTPSARRAADPAGGNGKTTYRGINARSPGEHIHSTWTFHPPADLLEGVMYPGWRAGWVPEWVQLWSPNPRSCRAVTSLINSVATLVWSGVGSLRSFRSLAVQKRVSDSPGTGGNASGHQAILCRDTTWVSCWGSTIAANRDRTCVPGPGALRCPFLVPKPSWRNWPPKSGGKGTVRGKIPRVPPLSLSRP